MRTHLCYGPMGAGKSAWLSSHYREHERAGDRVLALYPAGSERWAGPNRIASRSGQEIPAEPIECGLPSLALILACNEHEAVFIDDAHQLERDHAGHWRRQVLESGFKGDLYISTLGLGWDMELLQPARLLLREQLATSRHYLTAPCSAHGPRCRAAYSFMIDLGGPVVSDLRTPENPEGNYWALCYPAMLLCYQAQIAGLPLPEYPVPKRRRLADDFNLEMAAEAHGVIEAAPARKPARISSKLDHGTWDNPAPLYQVDVPRMPKPDFSGWVPGVMPDKRLPEKVRWQGGVIPTPTAEQMADVYGLAGHSVVSASARDDFERAKLLLQMVVSEDDE